MVAVDADDTETREKVAAFAEKLKLTHLILLGGDKAQELYDVNQVLPAAFWIDHRGRVVHRETGFRPQMEPELERRIAEMLRTRDADREGGPTNPSGR